jgi:hypothetical protein
MCALATSYHLAWWLMFYYQLAEAPSIDTGGCMDPTGLFCSADLTGLAAIFLAYCTEIQRVYDEQVALRLAPETEKQPAAPATDGSSRGVQREDSGSGQQVQ